MKWYHWLCFGLCVVIYHLITLWRNGGDNKLLKWLDKKSVHHQEKIKFINEKLNKRKLAYEIIKAKKIKMEKSIKSMPNSELDAFIKRHL
jgi:hypothetical protein